MNRTLCSHKTQLRNLRLLRVVRSGSRRLVANNLLAQPSWYRAPWYRQQRPFHAPYPSPLPLCRAAVSCATLPWYRARCRVLRSWCRTVVLWYRGFGALRHGMAGVLRRIARVVALRPWRPALRSAPSVFPSKRLPPAAMLQTVVDLIVRTPCCRGI